MEAATGLIYVDAQCKCIFFLDMCACLCSTRTAPPVVILPDMQIVFFCRRKMRETWYNVSKANGCQNVQQILFNLGMYAYNILSYNQHVFINLQHPLLRPVVVNVARNDCGGSTGKALHKIIRRHTLKGTAHIWRSKKPCQHKHTDVRSWGSRNMSASNAKPEVFDVFNLQLLKFVSLASKILYLPSRGCKYVGLNTRIQCLVFSSVAVSTRNERLWISIFNCK